MVQKVGRSGSDSAESELERERLWTLIPTNTTELLEDLSVRLGNVEQELKRNREHEIVENVSKNGPRPENCTSRNNVETDHDGMNLKNIKLEAPTFDDQLDP